MSAPVDAPNQGRAVAWPRGLTHGGGQVPDRVADPPVTGPVWLRGVNHPDVTKGKLTGFELQVHCRRLVNGHRHLPAAAQEIGGRERVPMRDRVAGVASGDDPHRAVGDVAEREGELGR